MSVSLLEKDSAAVAVGGRWSTRLLAAAALLAIVLVCLTDSAAVSLDHRRPFLPSVSPANGWISATSTPNFTATLLARWLTPGGTTCRDSRTAAVSLAAAAPVSLPAGAAHELRLSALDADGIPRCLGGDYFETDLSSHSWKSRPPISDLGNGSYTLKLQVHSEFAGDYNLTVVLLFRSFEGLRFSTIKFSYRREVLKLPIRFYRAENSSTSLPELKKCKSFDFGKESWSGRWTRLYKNDSCEINFDGRFHCLNAVDSHCPTPWCDGAIAALESNGWVYSAHCKFDIFQENSAWKCLNGKWIFFWGDSNHVDTIRNMLNFVLGIPGIKSVPRRFDMNFTNPRNGEQSVRITSLFNGHWNETGNYLGLQSLRDESFRKLIRMYFTEERSPDAVILNSGLHDGIYWKSIRRFSEGAEFAAKFWEEVVNATRDKPRVFYRTTIATGGYARDLGYNPNKMEAFNGVMVEKLRNKGVLDSGGVIDNFDMTFPWHYDNRCNDGVHYGRAPMKARWKDGQVGHQYFVDLMLVHVILNAICNE